MSFLEERALNEASLAPRDRLTIRQVHHPRLSPDLRRLVHFFCTEGVYAAAVLRIEGRPDAIVLAEAVAVHQRAVPGVSRISVVINFSGDLSTLLPLRHSAVKASLHAWANDLVAEWAELLARHGNTIATTQAVEYDGLRMYQRDPSAELPALFPFPQDGARPPCLERLELLCIQAWRTSVEGELLAFLFGTVRPDHRELIAQELTVPIAQLADDLPLDIIAQDDEHPVPHVLSRTLTPYLQWSTCVEGAAKRIPPSQQQYLDPRTARDPAFFGHPTAKQFAAIREEEEEEESTGSEEGEDAREEDGDSDEVLGEEEETPEEESYSEHSEGEQSVEEEEEDEEEEEGHEEGSAGLEWETVPEEALRTGTEAEDPEAARKRREIAAGKEELKLASAASLQSHDDPNRDPETPRPEDVDLAATIPTPSARQRSRSPSSPTRPPVRRRTDTGDRPSSPITLSPSP
ncbi:hypothetical protein CBR_g3134 [Chara braunii]|uniref:Uncharacterized protein n=1 Tax=Chara braunii TaxID=69332 RepID=A0A388KEW3_CHABU|nr:hypothetical protein CBR_g3134 [Chara braunii]|eukprot:GBG68589.1 hypothetical protein CBR_g3134 [Chara braunii]